MSNKEKYQATITIPAKKKKKLTVFAKRLFEQRMEMGLSQAEFAKLVGITAATVGYYENSDRLPDVEILRRLCIVCGCSSDYLIGFADAPTHASEDICKRTGLSPDAIETLLNMQTQQDTRATMALSYLIENDKGLLNAFYAYFLTLCYAPVGWDNWDTEDMAKKLNDWKESGKSLLMWDKVSSGFNVIVDDGVEVKPMQFNADRFNRMLRRDVDIEIDELKKTAEEKQNETKHKECAKRKMEVMKSESNSPS